jgi:hypothetical protein
MRLTARHPHRLGRHGHRPATTTTRPDCRTPARLRPAPRVGDPPPATHTRASHPISDDHPASTPAQRQSRPWGWKQWLLAAHMAVVAAVLTAATPAHAETTQVVALAATLTDVLTNIRNWVMGILAAIATVFLTWGGVRYLFAGGDPGEVEKAKSALKSAGIGYALAALAPLIVAVLQGIVGA